MKVKIYFLPFFLLLLAWSATRSARADIAVEAPAPPMLAGYRDGARWIAFARLGQFEHGREQLVLRAGGRSFRALVGPHAVVQLRPGLRAARSARERLRQLKLRFVRPLSPTLGIYLVAGEDYEDGAALAARLSQVRDLESVAPDLFTPRKRARIELPLNDARYGGQWYLQTIKIEDAWRLSSGARDVTVAVVDDGCDLAHPDLAGQFVAGRDVFAGDDDPSFAPSQQGNAHGTACSGVVAAAPNNRVGIVGVCPECTLSCVRLLNNIESEGVPLSADIAAFEFAYRSGAAVVSNSWGFAESVPVSSALASAVQRVAEQGNGGRGAVVVFAAGNENRAIAADEIAALPYVLAVGAVNQFDESAPFANYGAALDLSAPTGSLTTDISGPDGYDRGDFTNLFGGTSAACPVVAGVAGLAMAAARNASAADVRRALIESARAAPFATPDTQGHDPVYGYGVVDPAAALRALGAMASDAENAQDAGEVDGSDASARDAGSTHDAATASDAAGGELRPEPTRPDASSTGPADADQHDADQHDADQHHDRELAVGAEPVEDEPPPPADGSPDLVAGNDQDDAHVSQISAVKAKPRSEGGCSLGAHARPNASSIAWVCALLALTRRSASRGCWRCARRSRDE